ncbi:MAG: type II toxin-antitoxin system HicB family antitoxin [bacterium]|nr:type II toxin-antitoxin system HicB family antitoxin [bacterium]
MKNEFTIVYESGEDGWWIATALEYPGAISQGKTLDEARAMIGDALRELMLAQRQETEKEFANQPDLIREMLIVELDETPSAYQTP